LRDVNARMHADAVSACCVKNMHARDVGDCGTRRRARVSRVRASHVCASHVCTRHAP